MFAVAAVWQAKTRFVSTEQLISEPYIISGSWKYYGKNKVHHAVVCPKDCRNDKEVVKQIAEVYDDADIIVTHNGVGFDNKVLNGRLLFHGLPPLDPKKPQVDTLKVARKQFRLFSNKLDYIGF